MLKYSPFFWVKGTEPTDRLKRFVNERSLKMVGPSCITSCNHGQNHTKMRWNLKKREGG